MLVNQIKKDRITAMKAGDVIAKTILTVLVGDIQNKSTGGKDMPDTDVISLVKKYIVSNEEVLKYKDVPELVTENVILSSYLPVQMTELDIEHLIKNSGVTDLGTAMKFLKENYAGKYDGKLASLVAKRVFG